MGYLMLIVNAAIILAPIAQAAPVGPNSGSQPRQLPERLNSLATSTTLVHPPPRLTYPPHGNIYPHVPQALRPSPSESTDSFSDTDSGSESSFSDGPEFGSTDSFIRGNTRLRPSGSRSSNSRFSSSRYATRDIRLLSGSDDRKNSQPTSHSFSATSTSQSQFPSSFNPTLSSSGFGPPGSSRYGPKASLHLSSSGHSSSSSSLGSSVSSFNLGTSHYSSSLGPTTNLGSTATPGKQG